MSTEVELDGWLRPNYEWRTIIYTAVTIPLMWIYSEFLGFSIIWQVIISWLGIALCYPRIKSLNFVRTYKKGLVSLEAFFIKPSEVPFSEKLHWLGKGFSYTPVHAQRVWDSKKRNLEKYYQHGKLWHWLRQNEKEALARSEVNQKISTTRGKLKIWIAKHSKKEVVKFQLFWLLVKFNNPFAPFFDVGGTATTHGVGAMDEIDIFIDLDNLVGHTIILGQSRVGKTVWLRSHATQMIARKDGVTGVFDPKGDLELLGIIWSEAQRLGREEDFYCFLLGEPEISSRYNSIASFSRLTAIAARISDQMGGTGDSQVFKDFAFNFMTYVSGALLDMGRRPTYKSMKRYIEDLEGLFNEYGRFLMKRDNPTWHEDLKALEKPRMKRNAKGDLVEEKLPVGQLKGRGRNTIITDKLTTDFYERNPRLINQFLEGLRSTMKQDGAYTSKLTASLIPLLTKLTSGKIAELISPDFSDLSDERRTFSWDKIIQRKGIFYAGFSSMQDNVVAEAVGNTFFADLVAKAGEINNYGVNKGIPGGKTTDIVPIWLFCDEFQSLMGTEFIPLLNRSGSAGVRVMAFTQVGDDIRGKLGDDALAQIVLGNFNNIWMMRVANKETAEILTNQIGNCDLYGLNVSGATTDGGVVTPKAAMDDDDNGKSGGGDSFFGTKTQATVSIEANEPIIAPETIMTLPKGQAFAFVNRKNLYKLRLPIMQDESGESVGDMDTIRAELSARQQRPEKTLRRTVKQKANMRKEPRRQRQVEE